MKLASTDSRNLPGRNALLVLLVAPIVGVLWWFGSGADSSSGLPVGRTEERLRIEANEVLQKLGSAAVAAKCEYWSKHLYLVCELPFGLSTTTVAEAMQQSGWEQSKTSLQGENTDNSYAKGKDAARLECKASGSANECTLSLFAPR